jgi:hypothetical protein
MSRQVTTLVLVEGMRYYCPKETALQLQLASISFYRNL